jgi:hypothetical protein
MKGEEVHKEFIRIAPAIEETEEPLLSDINIQKPTSLNLNVKEDNYDACKTANIKI